MSNLKQIKRSEVKALLPVRAKDSHKGQNGRVLVVGGSLEYYGAPVLAGLGALRAGADLVYLYVPECNFDCTRSMYPDFVVRKYPGEYLAPRNVADIIKFGKKCDSVLIGPGLGDREATTDAVIEILGALNLPTILDADAILALKKIEKFPLSQPLVITPHKNEFRHLVDREVDVREDEPKSIVLLRTISMDLHLSLLLKGPVDYVVSDEGVVEKNLTGNAGMTVGGSGDVLAGVLAGLLAQGLEGFDACRVAAYYVGAAGDVLAKRKGVGFLASELAEAVAELMR